MKTLSIKEALEQGYTQYGFDNDGFQPLHDIENIDETDLAREDIRLVDKEPYSPTGIASEDIAELLAEHLQSNHSSECGDDTEEVYDAIKSIDFVEAEKKIDEALSKLNYYKLTNIRLISSNSPTAPKPANEKNHEL